MACMDKKMNDAEREQSVDLLMHGVKRTAKMLHDKNICSVCSLDMFLVGVFMFHKEIGGVTAEEALKVLMHSYNRAYAGEAGIYDDEEIMGLFK